MDARGRRGPRRRDGLGGEPERHEAELREAGVRVEERGNGFVGEQVLAALALELARAQRFGTETSGVQSILAQLGAGDDRIESGAGVDLVNGGSGNDVLTDSGDTGDTQDTGDTGETTSAALRDVLLEEPGHPQALALLADIYERRGDVSEAVMVVFVMCGCHGEPQTIR